MTESTQPTKSEPAPIDTQAEQLKLLKGINAKLEFFVILTVLYLIVSLIGFFLNL
jgi:hypothetical protein